MNTDRLLIIGIYTMIFSNIGFLIFSPFLIGKPRKNYTADAYIIGAFFCVIDLIICINYLKTF